MDKESSEKQISISINQSELKKRLKSILKCPNSDIISEVIIGNLSNTDIGLEQLAKSFMGLEPILKFNVLEEVLISFNGAYAWKINKELTLKDLRYSYKGLIKAEIIDVNPYSIAPYEISYKYIPVSSITDDEVEMSTHWVSEVCIIALTDYFIECDTSALPF